MSNKKVLGIDLGTVNSCVSVFESGECKVIVNEEGSRTTPSVVSFKTIENYDVGHPAKRQIVSNPKKTFYAVKRLLGKKFNSEAVTTTQKTVGYTISQSKNGDARLELDGELISPQEISAKVLEKMRDIAKSYFDEDINEAVITVPAHFDDFQRLATKNAAKIAGLNVLRIINEPTAAALAYGLDKKVSGNFVVFDLGGGTYDVSVLEINNSVFQVKSTSGDNFLGGEDFDHKIVAWILKQFKQKTGIDLSSDLSAMQRIKEAAENAKHELSSETQSNINLPFITSKDGDAQHIQLDLTRAEFEDMVKDLIKKLEGPVFDALKDAKLSVKDIDDVILVGGMTRMPKVIEKVQNMFNKDPYRKINPDEAVSVGAATQGAIIKGMFDEVVLLDVTPLSLGIQTEGGLFTALIERNSTIPTQASEIFSTTQDNQEFVDVHILQGEREFAKDNLSLAHLRLSGIPPAPRGVPQIEITFNIDTNGLLSVSAKDLGTGEMQKMEIKPTSGLTEVEINKIIEKSHNMAQRDNELKQLVHEKNKLQSLLYSIERSVKKLFSQLTSEQQENFQNIVQKAHEELKGNDIDNIKRCIVELTEVSHTISSTLYQ
ncbi:MAG TPA: molecular chaperone DnaK [Oligoflexia bacterium]|nr:molecular chaperone DnaK [Oligoflexia bacterium]HMR25645.1 molecular chaperone DnaK [Oligoflexia bacterium]